MALGGMFGEGAGGCCVMALAGQAGPGGDGPEEPAPGGPHPIDNLKLARRWHPSPPAAACQWRGLVSVQNRRARQPMRPRILGFKRNFGAPK